MGGTRPPHCPLPRLCTLRYIHRQPATLFFLVVDMYFLAALLIEIVYVTLVSTAHSTRNPMFRPLYTKPDALVLHFQALTVSSYFRSDISYMQV